MSKTVGILAATHIIPRSYVYIFCLVWAGSVITLGGGGGEESAARTLYMDSEAINCIKYWPWVVITASPRIASAAAVATVLDCASL